ncbi:hypothetical protein K435DRAFT_962318 [Dendrothele bispora CBS 962.96]|uniref:Uncharacterized protein n=1 Tax=Dendrothele bispora (strain CBS 962.96) TaxID=1314807 RepID=A0A4S8MLF3_DENBC|nr:hypothetical protein K435DRAFT_962318 [Dendrothele bispora CBS 962.96]
MVLSDMPVKCKHLANPDQRSIIEASKHGWWYTAQTPCNRPYHPSTAYNSSADKYNKYNTSNVRVVIYDKSARLQAFLKVLYDNDDKEELYQTPTGSTHLTSCCNSRNGPFGNGEKPLLELEVEAEVEVEDEGADANVDPAEVEKVSMKTDAMPTDPAGVVMAKMRYEREKERLECYTQVGSTFQDEFWGKKR